MVDDGDAVRICDKHIKDNAKYIAFRLSTTRKISFGCLCHDERSMFERNHKIFSAKCERVTVCKVAAAGCWLPCSTTNLTNIRKCILNARNYLSRTAIEAISIFEEFAFSSSFFSGKCARTEALGIHEHRNLSSSSTATTATTTTAFCFLYPSIRLFLFFLFRSVGWLGPALVCLCVCCVFSVSGLGN